MGDGKRQWNLGGSNWSLRFARTADEAFAPRWQAQVYAPRQARAGIDRPSTWQRLVDFVSGR